MSGKDKADPDFAAWDHTADHSSYFFDTDDYKESSILSEFGWNIPPESSAACSRDGGFPDFPPIEPDSAASPAVAESDMISSSIEPMAEASSSSDEQPEKSAVANPPAESAGKIKKKGQKRLRQPRFAFVTKSEVDHLEDGYRWRKYGQKAVKNSPFPRSYYRCTNSKCMVKKRIERSSEDPSVVITTYEGQHCHHSVGYPRATQEAAFPRYLTPSHSLHHPTPPPNPPTLQRGRAAEASSQPPPPPPPPPGEGLLGDIVPPRMRNNGY